jgi:hypothetical protein
MEFEEKKISAVLRMANSSSNHHAKRQAASDFINN